MFLSKILGRVRGLYAENYSEAREDVQAILNSRGDLVVAAGLPECAEMVRLGNSYQVCNVTGQAALTALPTTVAGLTLWNGEPGTGACYVIEEFGSWEAVVDATQTDVTAIFACNSKTPVAAPTDAALAIRSLSGKTYGGRGRTVAGGTIVNDGWFAHGTNGQMAAAAAGANWKVNEVKCKGLYLVPPGGAFNVQAVKAAAAAAAQQFFFIRWHEVQLVYSS